MYLTILDSIGGRHEALLLAVSASRMRVVVEGSRDTIELKEAYGQWFCEDGEPVEIVSIMAEQDFSSLCGEIHPRACAAGSPMLI
jgi:hypothetical protein